jgi:DNA-binding transcriptional LysR family regulator
MNKLEALRIFGVAADAVNFRDAATRLGISPQVVTRVIQELETELGELLFHRNTRGVRLTSFGEKLALKAGNAVAGLDEIFAHQQRNVGREIAGTVRIAAPSVLGRRFISPKLAPILAAHPGLRIDLRLSEVTADVVERQIDVGVRIGHIRDSRFVARPVSPASLYFVAAPALLKRVAAPANEEALLAGPLTVLIDRNTGMPWPWMFKGGRERVPPEPVFVTDDPETECEAVLDGIGFGQLPGHLALPHLRAGRLVSILEKSRPAPVSIYVYRPQRTPVPARVRLIFDALCAILAECEKA